MTKDMTTKSETMESETTKKLKDRVILVTGASSGIGREASKAFAAQGATVILLARHQKKLESLYDEIIDKDFPIPAIYPFNLATASPKDYEELKHNIEKEFGQLSGILHNAAMLGTLTPFEHIDIANWYKILQVNLHSAFLLTQATLPLLKKASDASIIFTLADVGKNARAYWGAYAISKFGCDGLMQLLAEEFEVNTNIRVNSIDPGKVKTALRASAYPGEDSSLLVKPEDIVERYVYLMSEESIGVNGQHFNILK